eukprot:9476223-Pyramimonas_sp.AAC.1
MRTALETTTVWRSLCPRLQAEAEVHLPLAQWVGRGNEHTPWPSFWVEPPLAWNLRRAAEAPVALGPLASPARAGLALLRARQSALREALAAGRPAPPVKTQKRLQEGIAPILYPSAFSLIPLLVQRLQKWFQVGEDVCRAASCDGVVGLLKRSPPSWRMAA